MESQKNRKGNEEITGKLVIRRKLFSRKSENDKAEREIWIAVKVKLEIILYGVLLPQNS